MTVTIVPRSEMIPTMVGSAFLLVGILTLVSLVAQHGRLTFDFEYLASHMTLASSTAKWLFIAFTVAFAVKFVPVGSEAHGVNEPEILIDNDEADGRENWTVFKDFPFAPYNLTGPDSLSDNNEKKGSSTAPVTNM